MNKLTDKVCLPCKKGGLTLKTEEINEYLNQISGTWKNINFHHIEKEFQFKNFKEALDFTNKVGALAEKENHHPDINLTWGKVKILLWTHKISGLTENDFILASKIDQLFFMNFDHC
ncbi:MAG: transcriptional coactivator/pterin dehydratase [uncultured bacterium]|nr:MAG: transcriptional coactivator/pterin dehydratase [uncultured bacterium]